MHACMHFVCVCSDRRVRCQDEFINTVAAEKAEFVRLEQEQLRLSTECVVSPLRPLITQLLQFSSLSALEDKIRHIYTFLDVDGSGSVDKTEFKEGLHRMKLHPPIYISDEDWMNVTEQEQLCDSNGQIDLHRFRLIIRRQMKLCMLTELVSAMATSDPVLRSMVSVLKLMLCQTDPLSEGPPNESHHQSSEQAQLKESGGCLRTEVKGNVACGKSCSSVSEEGVSTGDATRRAIRGEDGDDDSQYGPSLETQVNEIKSDLDRFVSPILERLETEVSEVKRDVGQVILSQQGLAHALKTHEGLLREIRQRLGGTVSTNPHLPNPDLGIEISSEVVLCE